MEEETEPPDSGILKDELEFIEEETKFLDKIPLLSNFFSKFLILLIVLIILIKYYKLLAVVVFSVISSYIKFKRLKIGIPIELEPTYLFMIVLTLSFGLQYGLFYILIPVLLSSFVSGFSPSLIINIWNKLVVLFGVHFITIVLPEYRYFILPSIILVIITDIISYRLRINIGQPIYEVILVLGSNSILRFIYLSILLEPLLWLL